MPPKPALFIQLPGDMEIPTRMQNADAATIGFATVISQSPVASYVLHLQFIDHNVSFVLVAANAVAQTLTGILNKDVLGTDASLLNIRGFYEALEIIKRNISHSPTNVSRRALVAGEAGISLKTYDITLKNGITCHMKISQLQPLYFLCLLSENISSKQESSNASPMAMGDFSFSKNMMKGVLETTVDGVIIINSSGIIQLFNKACESLFRYSANEVLGKNVSVLMEEPYASAHDSYIERYLKTRLPRIVGIGRKVKGRRSDGQLFPFELAVSEFKNESSHSFFCGIVRDLTEQEKVEANLRVMETVVSNCSGIFIGAFRRENERFLFINEAGRGLIGLPFVDDRPLYLSNILTASSIMTATKDGLSDVDNIGKWDGELMLQYDPDSSNSDMSLGKHAVTGELIPVDTHFFPISLIGGQSGVGMICRDIRSKHRAEKMKKKLDRDRLIMMSVVDGCEDFIGVAQSGDGKLLYLNRSGMRLSGLDVSISEEARSIFELVPSLENPEIWSAIINSQFAKSWKNEVLLKHNKSFEHIPMECTLFPISVTESSPCSIGIIMRDIQIRRREQRQQQRLEGERQKVEAMINNCTDIMLLISVESGKLIFVNRVGLTLLGIQDSSFVVGGTIHFSDIFSRQTCEIYTKDILSLTDKAKGWNGEMELRHVGHGEVIVTHAYTFAIVLSLETPSCVGIILRDLRETKLINEKLIIRDVALSNSSDAILVCDNKVRDYPIIYVNAAFTDLTGYTYQDVVGKNPRLLQGAGTSSDTVQEIRNSLRAGKNVTVTILNFRKNGTPLNITLSIACVRDTAGAVINFVSAARLSVEAVETSFTESLVAAVNGSNVGMLIVRCVTSQEKLKSQKQNMLCNSVSLIDAAALVPLKILYCNNAYCDLLNVEKERVIGSSLLYQGQISGRDIRMLSRVKENEAPVVVGIKLHGGEKGEMAGKDKLVSTHEVSFSSNTKKSSKHCLLYVAPIKVGDAVSEMAVFVFDTTKYVRDLKRLVDMNVTVKELVGNHIKNTGILMSSISKPLLGCLHLINEMETLSNKEIQKSLKGKIGRRSKRSTLRVSSMMAGGVIAGVRYTSLLKQNYEFINKLMTDISCDMSTYLSSLTSQEENGWERTVDGSHTTPANLSSLTNIERSIRTTTTKLLDLVLSCTCLFLKTISELRGTLSITITRGCPESFSYDIAGIRIALISLLSNSITALKEQKKQCNTAPILTVVVKTSLAGDVPSESHDDEAVLTGPISIVFEIYDNGCGIETGNLGAIRSFLTGNLSGFMTSPPSLSSTEDSDPSDESSSDSDTSEEDNHDLPRVRSLLNKEWRSTLSPKACISRQKKQLLDSKLVSCSVPWKGYGIIAIRVLLETWNRHLTSLYRITNVQSTLSYPRSDASGGTLAVLRVVIGKSSDYVISKGEKGVEVVLVKHGVIISDSLSVDQGEEDEEIQEEIVRLPSTISLPPPIVPPPLQPSSILINVALLAPLGVVAAFMIRRLWRR